MIKLGPSQSRERIGMGSEIAGLSVQQIRTFCGVYQHGGYADAEPVLGLTPPTMWEHVKSLEKIYGVELFRRSGRNIEPTEAGAMLYGLLAPLLVHLESTLDLVAEEAGGEAKEIRVVTGVRMVMEELGEPLLRFRRRFPDVKLRLMAADNREAQRLVTEGAADLALMIEPSPEMLSGGVTCCRLYPIEYLAALPPRHRLGRKPSGRPFAMSLTELACEPLIVGTPNTTGRRMLDQAWFRLGIATPPRVVTETDNSAITIACVRAGLGVGVIAGNPRGHLTRHVTTRSLAADLGQVHVVAAYRQGRQLSQVLSAVLEMIRDNV